LRCSRLKIWQAAIPVTAIRNPKKKSTAAHRTHWKQQFKRKGWKSLRYSLRYSVAPNEYGKLSHSQFSSIYFFNPRPKTISMRINKIHYMGIVFFKCAYCNKFFINFFNFFKGVRNCIFFLSKLWNFLKIFCRKLFNI